MQKPLLEGTPQGKAGSGTCPVGSRAGDAGVSSPSTSPSDSSHEPRRPSAWLHRRHFPARSLPRECEWTKAKKHGFLVVREGFRMSTKNPKHFSAISAINTKPTGAHRDNYPRTTITAAATLSSFLVSCFQKVFTIYKVSHTQNSSCPVSTYYVLGPFYAYITLTMTPSWRLHGGTDPNPVQRKCRSRNSTPGLTGQKSSASERQLCTHCVKKRLLTLL